MATFNKGILGGFSGKVGTIVGSNWRGLDVIRSLPKKTSRFATEKQLIVQAKFSLIAHFLAPLKPLLRTYFGQPSGRNLDLIWRFRITTAKPLSEPIPTSSSITRK